MRCAWTFTHPETGVECRAEYDGAILSTDVIAAPVLLHPAENRHGFKDAEEMLDRTMDDLRMAGVARTSVPSVEAAIRELRLVAGHLVEEAGR